MAYNNNAAYDLSHFAPQERKAKPQIKVVKAKKDKKKAAQKLKAKLIAAVCVVVALMAAVIYTKTVLFETVVSTNRAQQELTALINEEGRLDVELEGIVSLRQADDYASNVLGLVKMEDVQIIHVNLCSENAIEVAEQPVTINSLLTTSLHAVQDYFE